MSKQEDCNAFDHHLHISLTQAKNGMAPNGMMTMPATPGQGPSMTQPSTPAHQRQQGYIWSKREHKALDIKHCLKHNKQG